MKAWAMVTELMGQPELSPRADTEGTWNLRSQEEPTEMLQEQQEEEEEEDFCREGDRDAVGREKITVSNHHKKPDS